MERDRERRMEKERRKMNEPAKMQVQPQPERRNILEREMMGRRN